MPLKRVAIPSPNYSSRAGSGVRLVVLHTAEGALDYVSLGAYFANPASEVSSHTGIDDTPGECGEYVRRDDGKAWTQGNANPYCTSCELCGFASWDTATWNQHPQMLANVAAWVAEEAAHFGIPLVALTAEQAQSGAAGICQHVDLGADGGGHWDAGPGFPMDQVISMATGQPPVNLEDENVTAYFANNQHHVFAQRDDGRVDHWWMDLGTRPPAWAHEYLPKAA